MFSAASYDNIFSDIHETLRSDPSVGNFLILIRRLYVHRAWVSMPKGTRDQEAAAVNGTIGSLDGIDHRYLNLGLLYCNLQKLELALLQIQNSNFLAPIQQVLDWMESVPVLHTGRDGDLQTRVAAVMEELSRSGSEEGEEEEVSRVRATQIVQAQAHSDAARLSLGLPVVAAWRPPKNS